MNRVNARQPQLSRDRAPDDPGLRGVRVQQVRLDLAQESLQLAIRFPIVPRMNGPPRRVDDPQVKPAATSTLFERSLGPNPRSRDERHPVAKQAVLILAGQQRVLLRPANDEPRDVVDDVHGGRIQESEVRSQKEEKRRRSWCNWQWRFE